MNENGSVKIAIGISWAINALVGFWLFASGFNGGSTNTQGIILLAANVLAGLAIGAMLRAFRFEQLLISTAPLLFFSLLFANGAVENHQYGSAIGVGIAPLVMQGVPWALAAFVSRRFAAKS